ncbi:MAG TPA: HAMP domain-containing protein [Lysobacter sp.]
MSFSTAALLDRLMAPATRLMSRLTFLRKAIVIGLAFGLTCAVLAGIITVQTQRAIAAAQLQGSATRPLLAAHDAMLAMQQHREALVLNFFDDASMMGGLPALRTDIDRKLEQVEAWQAKTLKDRPLDKQLADFRAAWAKAQAKHADATAAATAHEVALREGRLLVKSIEGASDLSLATDPTVLYVGRSVSEWLPMLAEYSARTGVAGIRIFGEGSVWSEDRAQLSTAVTMVNYLRDRIEHDMAQIPSGAQSVQTKMAALAKAIDAAEAQSELIKVRALDADVPDMPVGEMAKRSDVTRAALAAAIHGANEALLQATQAEIAQLRSRALVVGLICALALALSGYLFYGFSLSTRNSLAEIKAAAQKLAAGEFTDKVAVDSRDELRDIGNSIEQAVGTLRRFESAQRAMFDAHQAGEIDERLDTGAFPGSFGVMAAETNTLVESHIAVKMRVVETVAQYARGDLSTDIERYPGKKAEVTAAVDAVKAGMQAINAEIKALVDAGVAGDLSRRGDATRFEFVYRDIVEGMNQLMATADHGMAEVGGLLAAVADGDLSRRVEVQLPGQFGVLAANANRTVDQLTQIVSEIRDSSDSINAAAGEIAAGNNDLSQRTEQQAAALEETASSMEELTSTVRQNAENARRANELATGAAASATAASNPPTSAIPWSAVAISWFMPSTMSR